MWVGVSWGCVGAKGQGAFHVDGTAAVKSRRTGSGSGRPVKTGNSGEVRVCGAKGSGKYGGAIEVVGISQEKPYEHEKDSELSLSVRAGDMLRGDAMLRSERQEAGN